MIIVAADNDDSDDDDEESQTSLRLRVKMALVLRRRCRPCSDVYLSSFIAVNIWRATVLQYNLSMPCVEFCCSRITLA